MIRIDSDTHFTPLDAFDDVDAQYREAGPHFEKLPTGRYKVIHPARDPFVPAHIKPLRAKGHAAAELEVDNLLGGTAAEYFGLKQYL